MISFYQHSVAKSTDSFGGHDGIPTQIKIVLDWENFGLDGECTVENRRVRMTKKLLKDAILELLETRDMGRITVTDICAAADVNRSTFYAHYEDVHQLLREIENDMLERMPALPIPFANQPDQLGLERLTEFLRYVQSNALLYRVMLIRRDGGAFFNRAVNAMMDAARQSGEIGDERLARYDCAYRLNGTIGIIREWIEDDFAMTPEELAKVIWYRRVNAQIV